MSSKFEGYLAEGGTPGAKPGSEGVPPQPPTLRSIAKRFGPRFLVDGLAPQAIFLALNSAYGLRWAIASASIFSLAVATARKRLGQSVGPLLPISVGFVLLRGTAGIVSRSDAVYFGPGIASNFIFGAAMIGSVLVRRPIVALMAQAFYPFSDEAKKHPVFRKVFSRLTLLWAGYSILTGLFQVWLLTVATTNQFVLLRALVGWPLALVLFVYSLRYPRREMTKVADLVAYRPTG